MGRSDNANNPNEEEGRPNPFSPLADGTPPLSGADAALLVGKKVIVVMPAYNVARTLRMTWEAIPQEWVHLVILVDDNSADETLAVAENWRSTSSCTHTTSGTEATRRPVTSKRFDAAPTS